jgi:hypothetical protein
METKIFATYKGQKYQLVIVKALLRSLRDKKDIWAPIHLVQMDESEFNKYITSINKEKVIV